MTSSAVSSQQGTLISDAVGSATRPTMALGDDGRLWIAWLRWTPRGDEIWYAVRAANDGAWSAPRALTLEPGQLIRPVLAAVGASVFCFWTVSSPEGPAAIWFSRHVDGRWSKPTRLLPDERRPHQNPELAGLNDGRLAVVYQVHDGKGQRVELREWRSGPGWAAPRRLSMGLGNDWDPVVAFDKTGLLHVVWSAYRDGDYDVVWSRVRGKDASAPERLSQPKEHDLHPSLAASPDGSVWLSWDAIAIPSHANSGPTTITGANLKDGKPDRTFGNSGAFSTIEVRRLVGDRAYASGDPRREISAPPGFIVAHGALPRVAVASSGEPWVIYRALRRGGERLDGAFWWEVVARPLRGGHWGEFTRLVDSDGYLEEASWASTPRGLVIAYSGARRQLGFPPSEPVIESGGPRRTRPGDRRSEVRVTALAIGQPANMPGWLERAPDPAPQSPSISGRHSVSVAGQTFQLLWGDTHRHSNISRCSEGGEPSPDDLVRYGVDVDRYDWLAQSDHRSDLNRENWWAARKLADLYDVPGAFSVLYNFEWEMPYPDGHHNMLFARRPTLEIDSRLDNLKSGWSMLAQSGLRAITIPHTTADKFMGTDWSAQDDRYRRVVEVYQACRGSYEHEGCPRQFFRTENKNGFYWNALEKGHHLGVIASSDHGWGVSYACVYARENTRDAVFDALFARRSYGATAYGIVLEMRSGEHWMGEQWSEREAPVIELYVRGAAPLRSIEIIGRSKVLHSEGSVAQPLGVSERRLRWSDPEWESLSREQWYYVRVIQNDDEMAWSSPIWVTRLHAE